MGGDPTQPPGCYSYNDGYLLHQKVWFEGQTNGYYINRGSIPTYVDHWTTVDSITDAFTNWVVARNPCDMDDRTDLSAGYRGDTNYWADIHLNSDGKSVCGERDDVGSVNFGTVQWGKSAVTCTWNTTYWDKRLEADTELNKRYNWTTMGVRTVVAMNTMWKQS